jgi:hypothetical protein
MEELPFPLPSSASSLGRNNGGVGAFPLLFARSGGFATNYQVSSQATRCYDMFLPYRHKLNFSPYRIELGVGGEDDYYVSRVRDEFDRGIRRMLAMGQSAH